MLAFKKPFCIIEIIYAITNAIKVVRNQKSFSDFAIQSHFSFATIDKVSVMSIFFTIGLKLLNFQNWVNRLMGCFSQGEYLWAKIKGKQIVCRSEPWSCFVNIHYIHMFPLHTCIYVLSSAVELDNAIWFRLWSGLLSAEPRVYLWIPFTCVT